MRGETAGYAGPLGKELNFYSEEMGSHRRVLSRAVVGSDRFYQVPSGCYVCREVGVCVRERERNKVRGRKPSEEATSGR